MEIKFLDSTQNVNVNKIDTEFINTSIEKYIESGNYPRNLLLEKLILEEKSKSKVMSDIISKISSIREKIKNIKTNYSKLQQINKQNINKLLDIL